MGAFYPTGTGSFPGVKRPGRGVYNPPHLKLRLKKGWSYSLFHIWDFVACSIEQFTFTFTQNNLVNIFENKACLIIALTPLSKFSITHRYLLSSIYLLFYKTLILLTK
jgi:hypothetical protein